MQHRESGDSKNLGQISPLMELCVHGGGVKFKRDVKVLDPNSDLAKKLKMVLSECVEFENSTGSSDPLRHRKSGYGSDDTESYKSADSNAAKSPADVREGESHAAAPAASCKRKTSKSAASKDESEDVIPVKVPRCGSATAVSHADDDSERCTLKTATGTFVLVIC